MRVDTKTGCQQEIVAYFHQYVHPPSHGNQPFPKWNSVVIAPYCKISNCHLTHAKCLCGTMDTEKGLARSTPVIQWGLNVIPGERWGLWLKTMIMALFQAEFGRPAHRPTFPMPRSCSWVRSGRRVTSPVWIGNEEGESTEGGAEGGRPKGRYRRAQRLWRGR